MDIETKPLRFINNSKALRLVSVSVVVVISLIAIAILLSLQKYQSNKLNMNKLNKLNIDKLNMNLLSWQKNYQLNKNMNNNAPLYNNSNNVEKKEEIFKNFTPSEKHKLEGWSLYSEQDLQKYLAGTALTIEDLKANLNHTVTSSNKKSEEPAEENKKTPIKTKKEIQKEFFRKFSTYTISRTNIKIDDGISNVIKNNNIKFFIKIDDESVDDKNNTFSILIGHSSYHEIKLWRDILADRSKYFDNEALKDKSPVLSDLIGEFTNYTLAEPTLDIPQNAAMQSKAFFEQINRKEITKIKSGEIEKDYIDVTNGIIEILSFFKQNPALAPKNEIDTKRFNNNGKDIADEPVLPVNNNQNLTSLEQRQTGTYGWQTLPH